MTFYERMRALASRQIAAKGSTVTIRGIPTPSDPVTGLGGADGAARSMSAVLTQVDYRTFPETIARAGDLMLLVDGTAEVGEKWVNGVSEWTIVAVSEVNPANDGAIITKALVRG